MTEFQKGDRVRIDFSAEGEVVYVSTFADVTAVGVSVDHTGYSVPGSAVTKIGPTLPTVEGSVIRITKWWGDSQNWTALLTAGGWHISPDLTAVWTAENMASFEKDMTFEVLYVPGENA